MKFHALMVGTVLAGSALLTACQSAPTITNNPQKAVTMPLTDSKLQNYDWQLVSVTNAAGNNAQGALFADPAKPLIIKFEQGGKISFNNTCNKMSGNYMLTNDNVVVGDIASTRMMCEPARMAFDSLAPTTVQGQYKLTQDANGQPVLTVTSANQISVFKPVAK